MKVSDVEVRDDVLCVTLEGIDLSHTPIVDPVTSLGDVVALLSTIKATLIGIESKLDQLVSHAGASSFRR
jgi:hypothetical protein